MLCKRKRKIQKIIFWGDTRFLLPSVRCLKVMLCVSKHLHRNKISAMVENYANVYPGKEKGAKIPDIN